jgi:starch phosphorylase
MGNQQKSQGKERPRTGTSPETLAQAILDNLYYIRGCPPELATRNDWYMALAYTVRDRLLDKWVQTLKHLKEDVKVVSYLSADFLLGPQLGNHLINRAFEQSKPCPNMVLR